MKGKKDSDRAAENMVRAQLTIRAAVWDISGAEGDETAKLDRECGYYCVQKLTLSEKNAAEDYPMLYQHICGILKEAGILEKDALLVTEHAGLAAYVYGQRQQGQADGSGMGVVYYEKDGGGKYVLADIVVQGFEEIGIQFLDRVLKRANGLPWNILYTRRTCVREITLSDLDELYELYEGEGITDYTEPLFERQKEEEYTKNYIKYMYYYYGYGMWVIRDRVTGKLIGRAGIEHRDTEDEVLMELGYIIGKEYQGRGYATEVCRGILEYAQQELQIEELHCFIHPENQVSVHVAERLGFAFCNRPCAGQKGLLHFRKILH